MRLDLAETPRLDLGSPAEGCWISTADARWTAFLPQAVHDFYHSPAYLDAVSDPCFEEACAYHERLHDGELLIPLLKRKIPPELCQDAPRFDAVSPYGYGGPVASRGLSEASLLQGIRNYQRFAAAQGMVTTFLRLHPVTGPNLRALNLDEEGIRLVNHGSTASINLTLDTATLNGAMRKNHRRDIKKLQALGFRTRIDCWEDYHGFQDVYRQTMDRVGANGYYHFDEKYFQRMLDRAGAALHLCSVVSPQGDLAAAGLFSRTNGIVQYHLGGSADVYLDFAPSKLMFHDMRDWAKDAGARILHLGGGLGARRDSLFMFKRGFATDEHVYQTVRIIHDMDCYRELQARWLQLHGCSGFPDPDFFPLYRSQLPA